MFCDVSSAACFHEVVLFNVSVLCLHNQDHLPNTDTGCLLIFLLSLWRISKIFGKSLLSSVAAMDLLLSRRKFMAL